MNLENTLSDLINIYSTKPITIYFEDVKESSNFAITKINLDFDEINKDVFSGEIFYQGIVNFYNCEIGRTLFSLDVMNKKMNWKLFYPYDFLSSLDKKIFKKSVSHFGSLVHYFVVSYSLYQISKNFNNELEEIKVWKSHHCSHYVNKNRVKHLNRIIYHRISFNFFKKRNILEDIPLYLDYLLVKSYLKKENIPIETLKVDYVKEVDSFFSK